MNKQHTHTKKALKTTCTDVAKAYFLPELEVKGWSHAIRLMSLHLLYQVFPLANECNLLYLTAAGISCHQLTSLITAEWMPFIILKTLFRICHSFIIIIIIIIIYPLTMRVVGAPQIIWQPVSFIFLCSSLPSGTWWTPGLSIPWCCLLTSSSVCLDFYPNSLCLARWFWPDLMNGRHVHTTAVCVSIRSSGDLHVVQLAAGSWHGLPRW